MSQDKFPSRLDFFRETLRRVTVEKWGEIVDSQMELAKRGDHRAVRWLTDQVGMTQAKHLHVTLSAVSGPAARAGDAADPSVLDIHPPIPAGTPRELKHRLLMRAAALAMDSDDPRAMATVAKEMDASRDNGLTTLSPGAVRALTTDELRELVRTIKEQQRPTPPDDDDDVNGERH